MKFYINKKIGYTAGHYGNSGEQFFLVLVDGEKVQYFYFDGQYGHEERIERLLQEKGYKRLVSASGVFGRLTRKDCKHMESEHTMLDIINKEW